MAKYFVTEHALLRFKQRVSTKGSHRKDFPSKVEEWCDKAIKHSQYIGSNKNGNLLYRFSDYIVVTDANKRTIITIKPTAYAHGLAPEAEETMRQAIKREAMRMIKPYLTRQQEILIEIHTQELKKLRVHNPNTKRIIDERIDGLHSQLDGVKKQINAHSSLAYQYGVNVEEG